MIKVLKNNGQDNIMAAAVAFIMVFALTFQYYFSEFISPETPLMKIGKIPFQHIEFVSIIFVLAMLAGVILSTFLLKEKVHKFVPICIALLGMIAIFIGMFTVDFFQKLAPTMRISHVIMTASRLNAIILAASGLFVGIIVSASLGHTKRIVHATVLVLILSGFAYSLNAFSTIYIILGVAIVLLAIAYGYIGIDKNCAQLPREKKLLAYKITDKITIFVKGGIISFFYIYGYYYFKNTLGLMPIVFVITAITTVIIWLMFSKINVSIYTKVICALAVVALFLANACVSTLGLLLVALMFGAALLGICINKEVGEQYSVIYSCSGSIVLAIIAMVVNHYWAQVTGFSSNRIVYEPSGYACLILLGLIAVIAAIDITKSIIISKNKDKNPYKTTEFINS